jgi:hypothetical protein
MHLVQIMSRMIFLRRRMRGMVFHAVQGVIRHVLLGMILRWILMMFGMA